MDIETTAINKLSESYKAGGPDRKINIELILVMVQAAASLIKMCPQKVTPTPDASNPERGVVRRHLMAAMREKFGLGGFFLHDGPGMVEAILDARQKATQEELDALKDYV